MEISKPLRRPAVILPFDETKRIKVQGIIDPLMLTDDQIKTVMQTLQSEMWMGLSRDEDQQKRTSLQMENTYVRSLLNGEECGEFLALDLGGTNFRVLLCRMDKGECISISRNYNVPTDKLYGPAIRVFDHLAESIYNFLKVEDLHSRRLPLGFTFSFPMVQESLKKGILVTWTKSFACPDGVGDDAVLLLEEAIARHGNIQVDVVAILNDTTGTLMAGSYLDKSCGIGLIMGTGCNAAYVEKKENVDKWRDADGDAKEVIIDIEWGAFGDNGSLDFIKTEFDRTIDLHSNHIGSFTFEKLFGGHYIGDLARLVIIKLANEGLLFGGNVPEKLLTWNSFTAEHLSDIEKDDGTLNSNTLRILKDLGANGHCTASDDVSLIRYICGALSIRAAQFVSASISVLLNHMGWPVNTVAIDGSLYRHHPNLHDMMTAWLHELAPTIQAKFILAEDGSGRGAAFVAAVADRLAHEHHTSS